MNIIKRVYNKCQRVVAELYFKRQQKLLATKLSNKQNTKRLYFFCTPTHSNLGDQAQLMCWLILFKEWYPDYEVIQVATRYRTFKTLRTIHENLQDEDLLFIHSGYLFFDPHPELPFILDIVRDFYDRKITILPQTVNIMGKWYQHVVSNVFNDNPNVTLICRDEVSYQNAKKLFPNIGLKLMPDVVTSLIGNQTFTQPFIRQQREGVLFCLRNDMEKFYSDAELNNLISRFNGIRTDKIDTTINAPVWKWNKHRTELVGKILRKMSGFQVIITDRYHGTIFSQIVNVPVIVLSSTDHKLSSGVKWFPKEEFNQNVFFAQDLDEAYLYASDILKRDNEVICNPAYFKKTYYNNPII